jgi:predicted Zn-dependent protease
MMLKKFIIISITTVILISCATSPLGRKQLTVIPAEQLDVMGGEAFQQLKQQTPVETNKGVNRIVKCVAQAIVEVSSPNQDWEVVVFNDDTANAFALPGGKIGVHTGLLKVAKNQHQLATVIGHEVAHVLADHSNERVSQSLVLEQGMNLVQEIMNPQSQMGQALMGILGVGAQFGVILPYSRIQESEADEMGLYFMAKAGFDPKQSVKLWQNMSQAGGAKPPEFMSTHPSDETRMARLNQSMNRALQYYQQAKNQGKKPRC